ncbi:MAG TPA: hypothetical protein VKU38_16670 [Ktedonobacteraceae bacterium]|nr:hypothetical protein [Ktedonobacteraceae bacterium]
MPSATSASTISNRWARVPWLHLRVPDPHLYPGPLRATWQNSQTLSSAF